MLELYTNYAGGIEFGTHGHKQCLDFKVFKVLCGPRGWQMLYRFNTPAPGLANPMLRLWLSSCQWMPTYLWGNIGLCIGSRVLNRSAGNPLPQPDAHSGDAQVIWCALRGIQPTATPAVEAHAAEPLPHTSLRPAALGSPQWSPILRCEVASMGWSQAFIASWPGICTPCHCWEVCRP